MLTDPIPADATYISGSAQASDGSPVVVENGQLQWSGQVAPGTSVIIEFAVSAAGPPAHNVAYLDDGSRNVLLLEPGSPYLYGLTINNGALYTNVPTATLRYLWDTDHATHVRFSNDSGFGPGDGTTDWIESDAWNPVYADWVLDTSGDPLEPRTVYAQFRDGDQNVHGPVRDDIVYDPNPPEVTEVEVDTLDAGGLGAMGAQDVIVRVTASDDNSGVSTVQLSHSADFAEFSEFPVAGPTTEVNWPLQPFGVVYVRAVDRAGNISGVAFGTAHQYYFPVVMRSYPRKPVWPWGFRP